VDNVYDFSWLVKEIDNSIILKLASEDEIIGIYQVSDILNTSFDKVKVRFANANDLINFINYSFIRFKNVSDNDSFIDIPIRKIWLLFLSSNLLQEDGKKRINLNKLDAFSIYNGEALRGNYFIYTYKINKESDELKKIMKIAFSFGYFGMQDKFDALGKINLINYRMANNVNMKRG